MKNKMDDAHAREDAEEEEAPTPADASSSSLLLDMDESWLAVLDDPLWPAEDDDVDVMPSVDTALLTDDRIRSEDRHSSDMNTLELRDEEERGGEAADPRRSRASVPLSERRRAYRARKKAELSSLRRAAKMLAGDLDKLQARKAAASATSSALNGRLVAGWRGVARRQKQRRMQVEALNRELRTLVRSRHVMALHLTDALHAVGAASPSPACCRLQKPMMAFDEDDMRLVKVLRLELGSMHDLTDSVLASCEMPTVAPGMEFGFHCARRWDEAAGCEFVEVAEAHAVPFDFPDTVTALYKALPVLFGKECEPAILQLSESPDTLAVKFYFSGVKDEAQQATPMHYECLTVTTGVDEATRCVIGWRSMVRVRGSPEISFVESSWGTAQALHDASIGEPVGTKFEFCTHVRSTNPSSDVASALLGKYLAQVAKVAPSDAAELTQAIENVLVDEMAALSVSATPK